jgi:hypothetical protein
MTLLPLSCGSFGIEREAEPRRLARLGSREMVRVNVDVGQEFQQRALGPWTKYL